MFGSRSGVAAATRLEYRNQEQQAHADSNEYALHHRSTIGDVVVLPNLWGVQPPEDLTLADAVGRMTAAAQQAKRDDLVLSVEAWEGLVLQYLNDADTTAFFREVLDSEEPTDPEDLKEWLERARAIWNATPRPDRGGKTADELSRQDRRV